MASDIFAKIGDIKGESLDTQAQGRNRSAVVVVGRAAERHHGPRRRRRRGQGELQRLQLHASRRQGVAGAVEGVRDRRAHQGSDDHGAQGRQGPAGVPDHQDDRHPHHQRQPERCRRFGAPRRSTSRCSAPRSIWNTSRRRPTDRSMPGSTSSTTSRATRKARRRSPVADGAGPATRAGCGAPDRAVGRSKVRHAQTAIQQKVDERDLESEAAAPATCS